MFGDLNEMLLEADLRAVGIPGLVCLAAVTVSSSVGFYLLLLHAKQSPYFAPFRSAANALVESLGFEQARWSLLLPVASCFAVLVLTKLRLPVGLAVVLAIFNSSLLAVFFAMRKFGPAD